MKQSVDLCTREMYPVAVLFARRDSVYKAIPHVDVWDVERDARTYSGSSPVIAHPPCRAWGRLSHFAKPRPDEKELALLAVDTVRVCGGVLEHPSASRLFSVAQLPTPGTSSRDKFGGFSFVVDQSWFGHRAPKRTWLYICGIEPAQLPPFPFHLGIAAGRVEDFARSEREATPLAFANWLIEVATSCGAK